MAFLTKGKTPAHDDQEARALVILKQSQQLANGEPGAAGEEEPAKEFKAGDEGDPAKGMLFQVFIQARALAAGKVVERHHLFDATDVGSVELRMVEWDNGYLIGICDGNGATYLDTCWFASRNDADHAWPEWIDAASA